ncbi:hypothetical protein BDZ89DRAFT_1065041 [Hymenopellis radicata]|nr:hypothetical protein BDZ89DRAFT_1065041 [Hymenopellis radicata]
MIIGVQAKVVLSTPLDTVARLTVPHSQTRRALPRPSHLTCRIFAIMACTSAYTVLYWNDVLDARLAVEL